MGTRGIVTEEIEAKATEIMGEPISTVELRLMPYIQYTMMNGKRIDPRSMNEQDWSMLDVWVEKGYVSRDGFAIEVTKEFWDIMNEMLWMGYAS